MMGGKEINKEPKKLKDILFENQKDQLLVAIKKLTSIINSQSKMIKE